MAKRFCDEWESQKHKRYPLLRTQYRVFKSLVWASIIFALLQTTLEFMGPLLVARIVSYVSAPESTASDGVVLIFAFLLVRLGIIVVSAQNLASIVSFFTSSIIK